MHEIAEPVKEISGAKHSSGAEEVSALIIIVITVKGTAPCSHTH